MYQAVLVGVIRGNVRAAIAALCLSLAAITASIAADAPAPATDKGSLAAEQQSLFQKMQSDPANLEVILAYANVSAQLGDNEAAVAALQRLLLFNPGLLRANLELGALYFRMGSFAMARAYFGKALSEGPEPEVKARIDQYLNQIAVEEAPSRLSGSVLLATQYQSDANVAAASPLINSPVGPLLLSDEFVKEADENVSLAAAAVYSYDLGTAARDTFEVAGTGFAQHYFRVQRLELDFGEVTAGPRLQFPDLGLSWVQSASVKPYAILNEVGLGQNQYFYTYGGGIEAGATAWDDLTVRLDFEFRHKTFSNAADRPQSTGLDGDDKVVSLGLAKPLFAGSVLTTEFDYLDQDTSLPYYANRSYGVSVGYRAHYDDPTQLIGLPWETTVWGNRLWSFYDAPDPCCNTSGNPFSIGESAQRTDRWRFGLTQIFQATKSMGIYVQLQREIVSSNLPLYGYTSDSVLIGPQYRFDAALDTDTTDDTDSSASGPSGSTSSEESSTPKYRIEGNIGGAFSSEAAKAALKTSALSLETNDVTLRGTGLSAGTAFWLDGPLAEWTGSPTLSNFSFALEYRHFDNTESAGVTATIPATGSFLGGSVAGSATGNFHSENLLLDAAWRHNDGTIHPYVGLGGGIAVIDWKATLSAPTLAQFSLPSSVNGGIVSPVAAGHLFAGLDYDITPQVYIGAGADFYFTDTASKQFTHSSVQLNANQLSFLGHVGYRF